MTIRGTDRRSVLRWVASAALVGVAGCERFGISGDTSTTTRKTGTSPFDGVKSPSDTSDTVSSATETEAPVSLDPEDVSGWPSYQRDLANTGYAPDVDAPDHGLVEQWTFDTDDTVYGTPAVSDGTLYVGSTDTHLYAIDETTGEREWSFETRGFVSSTPTVVDGRVFFGSGDSGIYALDAETGEELWVFTTFDVVRDSPAVRDGTVYVGGDDGILYAIDARTGEEAWRTDLDLSAATPAVADGTLYVGGAGSFYAVDAGSGTERWTVNIGDAFDYPTTVADRFNYTPSVADGSVYAALNDGVVLAFDAETGDGRWSVETPNERERIPSGFAVADDTVYVGTYGGRGDNHLLALDVANGDERWRAAFGNHVESPIVAGDTVLVGVYEDGLHALSVSDGAERWHYESSTTPESYSLGEDLVFTTLADEIVAFGPQQE